jgi:hypothetical protein
MGCLAVAVGRDGLLLALPLEQALLLRHLPPLMDVSAAPDGLWNRSYAASLELPPLMDAVAVGDALGFFLRLGLWGRSKRTGSAIVGWKRVGNVRVQIVQSKSPPLPSTPFPFFFLLPFVDLFFTFPTFEDITRYLQLDECFRRRSVSRTADKRQNNQTG